VMLKAEQGVAIMRVVPNSPADVAGVKPGDVIQNVQGQAVQSPSQVQNLVEKTQIGSTLPLQINRDGQVVSLNVKVGVMPNRMAQSAP
ncbi:MAG: PDZ domain-containing protein, partial [Microcystaceae cyanobacterium]